MKWLSELRDRFSRAPETTDEVEEIDAEIMPPGGGFFSTDASGLPRTNSKLAMARARAAAVKRTFQRMPGEFTPIDSKGELVPMAAGTNGAAIALDEVYPGLQQVKVQQAAECLPIGQLAWYASQAFIGYQTCAMLSQNWLIDKACLMPGKDAARHGYTVTVNDGTELKPEVLEEIKKADKAFKIKQHCVEHIHLGRVFGIRVAMFIVDGIDYEAPFNPDGVRPGSYKGISQIDPYWITPELSGEDASNPSSRHFYEPTWWRVNGRRIHRSHLVIFRNGQLPDILKPTYYYGGKPVPQLIMERVYAAERTANEAPLLAMTKRLTVLKIDVTKALSEPADFAAKMEFWASLMNNFGIKVIGDDESIEQYDTQLASLDETIMTQYQLVAAGANVPATKLLGTTPKGFNSTGEYEESSYHEELESIQEHDLSPMVERHHLLLIRSYIAPKFGIKPFTTSVNWKPTDTPTAKEQAEINKINADTDAALVNAGGIDGFDVRQRVIGDEGSGYNGIPDIVPGGPGDRKAQQEAEAALEQPITAKVTAKNQDTEATDSAELLFDPALGTLGGAKLITHQKFLDDSIVRDKLAAYDFTVYVTPPFDIEGKLYRQIMDGHHSLAAALLAKACPQFLEQIPKPEVFNAVTRAAMDHLQREEKAHADPARA